MKTAGMFFIAGGGGLGGLLISYMLARQSFPVELKIGAFLAMIGFGLVLIEGFLQMQTGGTDSRDSRGQPPG